LGIVQLIDPFYVKLPDDTFRRASVVGQFCWIPVTHLDPVPRILDVERGDPQEHFATKFSIRNMTDGDFKKKTRLPIKAALAVVHTELVLIHPFRDGNGWVARLLATLMALQAELPPLDFSSLKGYRRKAYYIAIRAGLDRDYKPMEDVFNGVIRKTLRKRRI